MFGIVRLAAGVLERPLLVVLAVHLKLVQTRACVTMLCIFLLTILLHASSKTSKYSQKEARSHHFAVLPPHNFHTVLYNTTHSNIHHNGRFINEAIR